MAIFFLDCWSDTVVQFRSSESPRMIEVVAELMTQGHRFFAVKPGSFAPKIPVASGTPLSQLSPVVKNEALRTLYAQEKLQIVQSPWGLSESEISPMTNAEEVVDFAATLPTRSDLDGNVFVICPSPPKSHFQFG